MLPLLKRHQVQVLLEAGHPQQEVADVANVSVRTVKRIAAETEVQQVDDRAERRLRAIGRPSKVEAYREFVAERLQEDPQLMSLEILRRAKLEGYEGGKSALYRLIAELRPREVEILMRFEGLPGEFSQHDFGQVDVTYLGDSKERVQFFGSRLKWSRWAQVTLIGDQVTETLVRSLADDFVVFGGVPLCAVFDRPKTVALQWRKDGTVSEWNPVFAYAALELGFTAEVCWPYAARQKGSVENLVGWVKGSFFKQRRFHDREDLQQQLTQWLWEINNERPSRATGVIPAERLAQERSRLRPLRITPEQLALRGPVQVGPTAEVHYDGRGYSMPPEAAGIPGCCVSD
jgi:transposase